MSKPAVNGRIKNFTPYDIQDVRYTAVFKSSETTNNYTCYQTCQTFLGIQRNTLGYKIGGPYIGLPWNPKESDPTKQLTVPKFADSSTDTIFDSNITRADGEYFPPAGSFKRICDRDPRFPCAYRTGYYCVDETPQGCIEADSIPDVQYGSIFSPQNLSVAFKNQPYAVPYITVPRTTLGANTPNAIKVSTVVLKTMGKIVNQTSYEYRVFGYTGKDLPDSNVEPSEYAATDPVSGTVLPSGRDFAQTVCVIPLFRGETGTTGSVQGFTGCADVTFRSSESEKVFTVPYGCTGYSAYNISEQSPGCDKTCSTWKSNIEDAMADVTPGCDRCVIVKATSENYTVSGTPTVSTNEQWVKDFTIPDPVYYPVTYPYKLIQIISPVSVVNDTGFDMTINVAEQPEIGGASYTNNIPTGGKIFITKSAAKTSTFFFSSTPGVNRLGTMVKLPAQPGTPMPCVPPSDTCNANGRYVVTAVPATASPDSPPDNAVMTIRMINLALVNFTGLTMTVTGVKEYGTTALTVGNNRWLSIPEVDVSQVSLTFIYPNEQTIAGFKIPTRVLPGGVNLVATDTSNNNDVRFFVEQKTVNDVKTLTISQSLFTVVNVTKLPISVSGIFNNATGVQIEGGASAILNVADRSLVTMTIQGTGFGLPDVVKRTQYSKIDKSGVPVYFPYVTDADRTFPTYLICKDPSKNNNQYNKRFLCNGSGAYNVAPTPSVPNTFYNSASAYSNGGVVFVSMPTVRLSNETDVDLTVLGANGTNTVVPASTEASVSTIEFPFNDIYVSTYKFGNQTAAYTLQGNLESTSSTDVIGMVRTDCSECVCPYIDCCVANNNSYNDCINNVECRESPGVTGAPSFCNASQSQRANCPTRNVAQTLVPKSCGTGCKLCVDLRIPVTITPTPPPVLKLGDVSQSAQVYARGLQDSAQSGNPYFKDFSGAFALVSDVQYGSVTRPPASLRADGTATPVTQFTTGAVLCQTYDANTFVGVVTGFSQSSTVNAQTCGSYLGSFSKSTTNSITPFSPPAPALYVSVKRTTVTIVNNLGSSMTLSSSLFADITIATGLSAKIPKTDYLSSYEVKYIIDGIEFIRPSVQAGSEFLVPLNGNAHGYYHNLFKVVNSNNILDNTTNGTATFSSLLSCPKSDVPLAKMLLANNTKAYDAVTKSYADTPITVRRCSAAPVGDTNCQTTDVVTVESQDLTVFGANCVPVCSSMTVASLGTNPIVYVPPTLVTFTTDDDQSARFYTLGGPPNFQCVPHPAYGPTENRQWVYYNVPVNDTGIIKWVISRVTALPVDKINIQNQLSPAYQVSSIIYGGNIPSSVKTNILASSLTDASRLSCSGIPANQKCQAVTINPTDRNSDSKQQAQFCTQVSGAGAAIQLGTQTTPSADDVQWWCGSWDGTAYPNATVKLQLLRILSQIDQLTPSQTDEVDVPISTSTITTNFNPSAAGGTTTDVTTNARIDGIFPITLRTFDEQTFIVQAQYPLGYELAEPPQLGNNQVGLRNTLRTSIRYSFENVRSGAMTTAGNTTTTLIPAQYLPVTLPSDVSVSNPYYLVVVVLGDNTYKLSITVTDASSLQPSPNYRCTPQTANTTVKPCNQIVLPQTQQNLESVLSLTKIPDSRSYVVNAPSPLGNDPVILPNDTVLAVMVNKNDFPVTVTQIQSEPFTPNRFNVNYSGVFTLGPVGSTTATREVVTYRDTYFRLSSEGNKLGFLLPDAKPVPNTAGNPPSETSNTSGRIRLLLNSDGNDDWDTLYFDGIIVNNRSTVPVVSITIPDVATVVTFSDIGCQLVDNVRDTTIVSPLKSTNVQAAPDSIVLIRGVEPSIQSLRFYGKPSDVNSTGISFQQGDDYTASFTVADLLSDVNKRIANGRLSVVSKSADNRRVLVDINCVYLVEYYLQSPCIPSSVQFAATFLTTADPNTPDYDPITTVLTQSNPSSSLALFNPADTVKVTPSYQGKPQPTSPPQTLQSLYETPLGTAVANTYTITNYSPLRLEAACNPPLSALPTPPAPGPQPASSYNKPSSTLTTTQIAIISTVAGVLVLGLVIYLIVHFTRKKKTQGPQIQTLPASA